ncbi:MULTISPECIES: AAA family ATPase [unclassified Methylobacterium]|uniref:AAA family ATPase n=1 Tax=unclassified Methylobacterium TaxID=2615210 RepID=UPI0011C2083B|nr:MULTISPECIES: AAA family ATPase [unclassified Methylobacterium]QEE41009.1 AAA family ATPase [Methylobacterium sp. WL1]TXN58856.1 AAA family ATPase [Methylobacterium sp. WL2]
MSSTKKQSPRKRLDHLNRAARKGAFEHERASDPFAAEAFLEGEDEPTEAAPVTVTSPVHTLAKAALTAAMTRAQARRFATTRGLSVLIEAPTPAWVQPLRRAVSAMGSWTHCEARDAAAKPKLLASEGETALVELLAMGSRVAVVSWLPGRYVPRSYMDACDLRVSVGHPSAAVLRSVIRDATGTRPRRMPTSVQGLDYPDFLAAIRTGGTASAAVRRLEATAGARTMVAGGYDDAPPVEDLVGYGEAGAWARRVVASVRAWRRGEGPWPAGTLNACLASAPGLGKTTLMRSLARSCQIPVVTTSVASWFAGSGYLDDVLRRMQEDLLRASSSAPCILAFDEADALPTRAGGEDRHASYWMPILGSFLSFLDGLGLNGANASRIIVVAATNAPHRIDAALLRPGRFGGVIRIEPPDAVALAGILRQHLRDDLADADLDGVAAVGVGASGAEARSWVESARHAARLDGRAMTVEDLIRRAAPADGRSATAIWRRAAHEAGHAVCVHVGGGGTVQRISIVASGDTGGMTVSTPGEDAMVTPAGIETHVVGLLGGRAAEEALGLGVSSGSHVDLGEATTLVAARHVALGMAGTLVRRSSIERAAEVLERDPRIRAAAEEDLQRLYGVALALVHRHRPLVEAVARLLVERRVVDGAAFHRLADIHGHRSIAPRQGEPRHG